MLVSALTGRTALVTGGGRGIGRAICLMLASQGASVLVNYAGNEAEALETVKKCSEYAKAAAFKANAASYSECETMFKFCEETLGSPDILINNAGITRDKLIMQMSEGDFQDVLDVNLKGTFNCVKLAFRPMSRKRFGRIVNISSVVGISGNAGQANYAASKAGIIGLTKSAAKEYAKRCITVNAIAPGFIETDMTAVLNEQQRASMLERIPLGRFGEGSDVAALAVFLCTDGASYITGQVISVDGGMAV